LEVKIPSNELWALNVLRITQGRPDHEPYLGKAWDWADARFILLPFPEVQTPVNESLFRDPKGTNLLIIRLMQPLGGDGDARKEWRMARQIPDGQDGVYIQTAKAVGRPPISLAGVHADLGLNEYDWITEYPSQFFVSKNTIIRCWSPPLSEITHPCVSSFNLPNGILVNVMFPYKYLSEWRGILDFAHQRAASYITY